MKTIEFPVMRMNVLYTLNSLSDPSYQIQRWVNHEKYGSIDEVVHCLFDDSCFEREPRRMLKKLLFDETEADRIKVVMNQIDKLFETYGKDLSDADYIAKREWRDIMSSAQAALNAMKENDLRYMEPAQRAELYNRYNIAE